MFEGVSLGNRIRNLMTDIECEFYALTQGIEARFEVEKAYAQMKKNERKAENNHRASGNNKVNNEASNNTSDNIVTDQQTANASATVTEINEKEVKVESKAGNTKAEAVINLPTSKKEKAINVNFTEVKDKKNDEMEKAEAEAPVEPADAHVIPEAAMNPQQPPIPQPVSNHPQSKINLGFGVTMDLGAMNASNYNAPQQPPTVAPQMFQHFTIPQQFNQPIIPQQPAVPPQAMRHKVDAPPPAPKAEKANPDHVNVDLSNIQVPVAPPPPPKEWPVVVAQPLPQAEQIVEQVTPKFDNTAITSKWKYMAEIEKIALETGHQIQMILQSGLDGQPNGIISCITWNEGKIQPNPYKGFSIDTGSIIDRRAKLFPVILQSGYENFQAYGVLIPKPKPDGKGNKNQFNNELFHDLFSGGVQMLDERKGMYSPDFRELNKVIAMITVPVQNMSSDNRKKIRDRLMNAMKSGFFEAALKIDPNSRFRFVEYNKKDHSFKLSNVGVPKFYGTPPMSVIPIEIHFEKDSCKLVQPKNLEV